VSAVVFVDTSALYAVLDLDDPRHGEAAQIWQWLLEERRTGAVRCCTHSAVVTEASALVQRRLGFDALRDLHRATLPLVDVVWIDEELHGRAVAALLAAGRRDVSLVDWTSFELMRAAAVSSAFAFDAAFADQGFELLAPTE